MAVKFPDKWYRNPDFLTGTVATLCAGAVTVDLVHPGTDAFKWCLLINLVFGAGSTVISQLTTAAAAEKPSPTQAKVIAAQADQIAHMSGADMPAPKLPEEPPKAA